MIYAWADSLCVRFQICPGPTSSLPQAQHRCVTAQADTSGLGVLQCTCQGTHLSDLVNAQDMADAMTVVLIVDRRRHERKMDRRGPAVRRDMVAGVHVLRGELALS